MTEKDIKLKSLEEGLNLENIKTDLGYDFLLLEDNIAYSCQKLIERFATKYFGQLPYLNQLTDTKYGKQLKGGMLLSAESGSAIVEDDVDAPAYQIPVYDEDCDAEEMREKRANLDMNKTLQKILEVYPNSIVIELRGGKLENHAIFNEEFIYYGGVFYMKESMIPQKMLDCKVEKEDKPKVRWVMISPRGFVEPQPMTIEAKEGFEDNYNDDLYPKHEKIVKLIHEKSSSLILLHGKPGTGKTTYIRQLIKDNPDVMFYWIDCSLFKQFTSSEFIDFIRSCKNSVFVVEDAEFLLESRDSAGGNLAMQTLLNISDGMLGDSLHLKFICTFNTEDKIDPALLRKGRMKMKYEFKLLEVDRANNLFKKLGIKAVAKEPMSLADVYNYEEDNGTQNEEKKKIGFQ